jgi:hypothetical protein
MVDPLSPLRVIGIALVMTILAGLLPSIALAGEPPAPADTALHPQGTAVAVAPPASETTDPLAAVDPSLRALLSPVSPRGPYPDRTGEDVRVDLVSAEVWLEGTHLVGNVQGVGVADNGAWLDLDTRGGPAADLRLGFGRGWAREMTLDGRGGTPFLGGQPLPEIGPDGVWFDVDLAGSDRFDPTHAGAVTASVKSFDGTVSDVGPAGFLGVPGDDAQVLFDRLAAEGPLADPDLAAALAVTFGTLRPQVDDAALALLDADVLAWYRYGLEVDGWLAEHGAGWRLADASPLGKLVWAWPAAQTVAYGGLPLAGQTERLTPARYRYLVPSVDQLTRLRDLTTLRPSAGETADGVDAAIWGRLVYRTNDTLMASLCHRDALPRRTCDEWRKEQGPAAVLATVDGVALPRSEGVSAGLQLELRDSRGGYVGDCAVATSLAIWQLQAVGLPAIGMGWAGTDPATPTHDLPLWLDGDVFRATQHGPGRDWAKETAFVYVTLPGVHPLNAYPLGREPNGWSRGGSVAGGWTRFAEVRRILADGLPAAVVQRWVDVQAAGGWPTW